MTLEERIERLKIFLHGRKRAYETTFPKNSIVAQTVLADLAKFCRADKTTFHSDPRIHAVLEGRREVWLRITNHLNLSQDELYKLFAQKDAQS